MRIGVVGVGRMGLRHIQVARNLGWSIVGVTDSNAAAIQNAAEQFALGKNQLFASLDAMLRAAHPDALAIATTAPSHAPLVLQGAAYGVGYILCEKPMGVSIEQCESMIEECTTRGVKLAVNHQMRFMEQYTSIKERVDAPELGGLQSIVVLGSNFGLAMNGTHYFEMFRFMTDHDVGTVSAWLDDDDVPNPRGSEFKDRGGQVRCVNTFGQTLILDCRTSVGHGVQVAYSCRNGQITVDELSGKVRTIHRKGEFLSLPTTRYAMPAEEVLTTIAPADVVAPTEAVWRAMVGGQTFPDGYAGLHAVRCAAAAHASHELGGMAVNLNSAAIDVRRVFPWA